MTKVGVPEVDAMVYVENGLVCQGELYQNYFEIRFMEQRELGPRTCSSGHIYLHSETAGPASLTRQFLGGF